MYLLNGHAMMFPELTIVFFIHLSYGVLSVQFWSRLLTVTNMILRMLVHMKIYDGEAVAMIEESPSGINSSYCVKHAL